ncbi:acyl-CoA dehydrogenase family protein [Streptomyces sp. NBC_01239]|uniref:acyl-CoA dehydrogenase family protein n=1 Tax=Streptomyces sp. NBC_01239 TaxID=2903792 RepID=UPI002257C162|nr:acyl-CoA dehydrogenase family protein [Streptomyces sp. NBC_01239]MCX4815190.1 acyl-CoA dehydrogenase family protein [Streptomyces sp. NBC_01239]
MPYSFYEDDHTAFRHSVRGLVQRSVLPHQEEWEEARLVDRSFWKAAAGVGALGLRIPERFGGAGSDDYRFRCVIQEELAEVGAASLASGIAINEDIVASYLVRFGTEEQQRRWLPGMAAGDVVTSIAMTEPGGGSDLRGIRTLARRDGSDWVLDGAKTFITNGAGSDLVIVAARTGETAGRARLSLFLVPSTAAGFQRGRKLKKLGLHAQDTAELFFDGLRLPADALLGEEGTGFRQLTAQLPLERLSIAWRAVVAAEAAVRWTLEYTRERTAFGQRLVDFQNTRFRLAELTTEVEVTRSHLERCILDLNDGTLDAITGAKAKWWATELQNRVVGACLQLHGGYGYMDEYRISRAYADARVQTLVGGTTEIMKDIIGRDLAGPKPDRGA